MSTEKNKEDFLKVYECHYNVLRKWNTKRSINEKIALEKFYSLKRLFDAEKKDKRRLPSVGKY